MIKKVSSVVAIVLLALIVLIPIAFADNTSIISVKDKKVKPGDKVNVMIDLTNVKDITKVEISTDIYLEPLVDSASGIKKEDTQFTNPKLTISNVTVDTIYITYTIPSYIASGTKIKLTATGLDDKDEQTAKSQIEIEVVSDSKSDQVSGNTTGDGNIAEDGNTINPGNTQGDKNTNTGNTVPSGNTQNQGDTSNIPSGSINNQSSERTDNQSVGSTSSNSSAQILSVSGMSSGITTTVTYKGSRNNYLSQLSIEGYELNPGFNKTNNTYFLDVANDVTSLTVNATKEDTSAVLMISGNTNLKEGINKILISVTAKNDDIRYYRIYVTRKV